MNRLHEAALTCTHNLCFRAKIRKMYTPVNPSFTIQKWDVKGYALHGCVTMMLNLAVGDTVKQTKFMRGCFGYNL